MKKAILFMIISVNTLCANFDTAFDITIKHEGHKIVKTKFGEFSKFGITKNTLDLYNKKYKTNYKVEHINKEISKKIYKQKYWNAMKLSQLDNQMLANNIFDYGVNSGIYKASKDLQYLCNELIEEHDIEEIEKIDIDGIIGNKTIETLNILLKNGNINNNLIIQQYKNKRLSFLRTLKGKWDMYGRGWTNRVNSI